MQRPSWQCAPPVHAGESPHWQVPVAEQLSAVVRSQVTQVPPPTPQVASDTGVQTPLAQQPAGQDCALQTQAPAVHIDPLPHETPAPQVHAPDVGLHPSLIRASHARHA